jgi:hypothetical protein
VAVNKEKIMKNLISLLEKGFVSEEELDTILEECESYEDCGMSGTHNGYHWYNITEDGQEYDVYCKF